MTLFLNGHQSASKHKALSAAISLFNRFSEESLTPDALRHFCQENGGLRRMEALYQAYLNSLTPAQGPAKVDFSLLQQAALRTLNGSSQAGAVFRHVIIDEYQDTNAIQEQLFFTLAKGQGNLCVVGDDDQALYRFRGATVENFVQFPARCRRYLNKEPTQIDLNTNYRASERIVSFYRAFMDQEDWRHAPPDGHQEYRIPKQIKAQRQDQAPAVVASTPARAEAVAAEIAGLVVRLLKEKKVADPNQIAFLFPSLKAACVERMKTALEAVGLKVYAPPAPVAFWNCPRSPIFSASCC